MKKVISGLLFWLSLSGMSYAAGYTVDELPKEMYLTQHWISYTTSFDIETKTRKLGTLYRRVLSFPLSYDFYDNSNMLMTTARARFFSIGAHFDVFDGRNKPLGFVEEKIFTFFPSFVIYSNDSEKLAKAEMNFWGTTFTVSDVQSNRVMAIMYRSFFRIKNDWTIEIKDKELMRSKNIDPGLFMTVLAFQADREYWEQQRDDDYSSYAKKQSVHANATAPKALSVEQNIQAKVKAQLQDKAVNEVKLMDQTDLEALVTKLQDDYQSQTQGSDDNMTDTEKLKGFVDYCLSVANSDSITPEEKKAILYLLEQRLSAGDAQDTSNQ